MKKLCSLFLLVILAITLVSCNNTDEQSLKAEDTNYQQSEQSYDNTSPSSSSQESQKTTSAVNNESSAAETDSKQGDDMRKLNIQVGNQDFTVILYDNPTTRALLERLPMTLDMSELNGNEKYYYLSYSLPTNSERAGNIHTGDLMLYGSDCLVLFYESFSTSYNYTKLGYIEDVTGLANALGSGDVQVSFSIRN